MSQSSENSQTSENNQENEYNQLIKEATYKVIKTALENGFSENSKFIKFYCKCARSIRDSFDPELIVRSSSLKIFPYEDSYEDKKIDIIRKYKGNLQRDLLNLYHYYYLISNEERDKQPKIFTDNYVEDLLNNSI